MAGLVGTTGGDAVPGGGGLGPLHEGTSTATWLRKFRRWLADRDFVTREEFDAVRAMAQKAREENEALKARIEALEK